MDRPAAPQGGLNPHGNRRLWGARAAVRAALARRLPHKLGEAINSISIPRGIEGTETEDVAKLDA